MWSGKGFTLVELMVAVLILGALAAIAIPRIMESGQTAKINVCRTNVDVINSQIELFYVNEGFWPSGPAEPKFPDYFPDGMPECPFGTPYEIDPGTHRVIKHSH